MGLLATLLIGCAAGPAPDVVADDIPVADPEVLALVAVGDVGKGNEDQRRVARAIDQVCAERGCDLVLLLGDNVYPRGMRSPDDPAIDALLSEVYGDERPLLAVLGNHDYGHGFDREAAAWQVAWARRPDTPVVMPAPTYRVRAGPAELFALDTTEVFWRGHHGQARWLRDGLAASTAPWRVVFGHHPFRSEGDHGNAGRYEGLALPWVGGKALRDLFEGELCGAADLYLAGHDHNLQWLERCGVQLVVSGAGASARPLVSRGNDPIFAAGELGFAWISLGRELRIAFHDRDGRVRFEGVRTRESGRAQLSPIPRESREIPSLGDPG